ncbi:hypothetical protein E2C01_019491 [Portunus trituberculatus]|uniref:Uncharacterized protein n=1 Tax=Portunus trituberculatus TaxID=210409 RepID=A0A5B7DZH7_PORTR|nr:hypothetical protein [Portunus trituberculatus]
MTMSSSIFMNVHVIHAMLMVMSVIHSMVVRVAVCGAIFMGVFVHVHHSHVVLIMGVVHTVVMRVGVGGAISMGVFMSVYSSQFMLILMGVVMIYGVIVSVYVIRVMRVAVCGAVFMGVQVYVNHVMLIVGVVRAVVVGMGVGGAISMGVFTSHFTLAVMGVVMVYCIIVSVGGSIFMSVHVTHAMLMVMGVIHVFVQEHQVMLIMGVVHAVVMGVGVGGAVSVGVFVGVYACQFFLVVMGVVMAEGVVATTTHNTPVMLALMTSGVGSSQTVMEQHESLGSGRVSHFSAPSGMTLNEGSDEARASSVTASEVELQTRIRQHESSGSVIYLQPGSVSVPSSWENSQRG